MSCSPRVIQKAIKRPPMSSSCRFASSSRRGESAIARMPWSVQLPNAMYAGMAVLLLGRHDGPRQDEAPIVHAVSPCGRTAVSYAPALALPVLPLLAVGLLGYAGYRVAKTAVTAERDRRRRDWFVVQDPEAVAAGKEEVVHGGGGLTDRRAWLKANALSTSYAETVQVSGVFSGITNSAGART